MSDEWYKRPLTLDDWIAGGVLLVVGLASIGLYGVVAFVMKTNDKEIVGFRFLFSAAVADIFLVFNYSIWPAMTILFKSEIIAKWMRGWVQIYLDFFWFAMVYHYVLISWSRFAAINYPSSFRVQSKRLSYNLCFLLYGCSLVQVLATHFQSFYVLFYFAPENYGMICEDFPKYLNDGQSLFFAVFHFIFIVIPAAFYVWALILLYRHRRNGFLFHKAAAAGKVKSPHSRTEARLIVPCVLNTVVFIIGQIVITVGTGEGKWATWSVLLLFTANSAVNPVLFLVFSSLIREKSLALFRSHVVVRRLPGTPKQSQQITSTTNIVFRRNTPSTHQMVVLEPVTPSELKVILDEIRNADPRFQTYL